MPATYQHFKVLESQISESIFCLSNEQMNGLKSVRSLNSPDNERVIKIIFMILANGTQAKSIILSISWIKYNYYDATF